MTLATRLLTTTALAGALLAGLPAAAQIPEPAAACGGAVEAAGPAPEPLRLAFLSFQGSTFWEAADVGANAAIDYLDDFNTTVDYIQLGTDLTEEAVIQGIEGALAQQYDGIAVVPIFDGAVPIINEAAAEDVPVMSFIAEGAAPSERLAFMGQMAYDAGRKAGEMIVERMGGDGKLAVLTGYFGATQHNDRMNGALDMIREQHPGIEIIGPFETQDRDDTAYGLAQDVLTANPDLEMFYVTAGGTVPTAKAVRDNGLTGQVGVVGYDITPDKTPYIEGGEIVAVMDQAPCKQAFDSLVMLHNHLVTGEAPPDVIPVEPVIGDKDNWPQQ